MKKRKITIVKIYFSKSYLKPYTEHSIDCLSSRIKGKTSMLKKRGFDIIRYEYTGIEA